MNTTEEVQPFDRQATLKSLVDMGQGRIERIVPALDTIRAMYQRSDDAEQSAALLTALVTMEQTLHEARAQLAADERALAHIEARA